MTYDPLDRNSDYGPAEKKKPPVLMVKIPLHKVWNFFKKWKKKKETVRRRNYER